MNVLDAVKAGLALIAEGRAAIDAVRDAVKDGKAAVSTTDLAELNRLLAVEGQESQQAHDALKAAIEAAEAKK